MNDNNRKQLNLIPLNLIRLKKKKPDETDYLAEYLLENLIVRVNDFINNRERSDVSLPWVTSLIDFYSNVSCFEISDAFFQRVELTKLVKFYQTESLSYLMAFIQPFVRYLRRCKENEGSIGKRKKMIRDVFREINLGNYANSINDNLQERWNIVSKPGYSSDNQETLSSIISGVPDLLYKASNLSSDEEAFHEIRSQVGDFYSKIDFRLLGKLLEVQKKGLGPITKIINMVRKADCDKALIEKMLSEIDFQRLAKAYNDKPPDSACNQLGAFCKTYLYTKSLHEKWIEFFATIDLSECFMKGGFSIVDTTFMLQILTQLFKKNTNALSNVLSYFDFEQVGFKARGKKNLNRLFRWLLIANLTKRQYQQFIDGLGIEKCKQLASDRDLQKIINRCNYSNKELSQFGIDSIFYPEIIDCGAKIS